MILNQTRTMVQNPKPRVVSAERIDGSVVITFDDSRCALYPSSLLYEMLTQARELSGSNLDEEAWNSDKE